MTYREILKARENIHEMDVKIDVAINKEIPKHWSFITIADYDHRCCPVCQRLLRDEQRYCDMCGQRIGWKEDADDDY